MSYSTPLFTNNSGGGRGPTGPAGPNSYTAYTVYSTTIVANYSIDVNADYDYYQVSTPTSAVTITLPAISTLTNNKRIYTISDIGGNLPTNNLIIATSGGNTLGGQPTVTLPIAYSSITVVSNTDNIWLIT